VGVHGVFQKLNLTTQSEIAVFGAPKSFEPELEGLKGVKLLRNPKKPSGLKFALAFAITQAELDRLSALLAAGSEGDAIVWFAYPKGTSKRYRCEFNRDQGWQVMRAAGFETVRQIAIDEDWSALRFRRLSFIKNAAKDAARQRTAGATPTVRAAAEDRRLARLSAICAALPESQRKLMGDHADFRVRGKVFAYFLNNHHGDGIVSVCCKSALGENVDRASREPQRFYLPAYIGPRGWFGLRLDGDAIDWREVKDLIGSSYRLVAPKTLSKRLDSEA
jgi:predicted DNA-binding protein (MmcQ/YjbR family)